MASSADHDLEFACRNQLLDQAEEALEEGADPNALGGDALFWAITHADEPLLRLLLDRGADASNYLPAAKLKSTDIIVSNLIQRKVADPSEAEDLVDADLLTRIDGEISENGIRHAVGNESREDLTTFRDGLKEIKAKKKVKVVKQLLTWLDDAEDPEASADDEQFAAWEKNYRKVEDEDIARLSKATNDGISS